MNKKVICFGEVLWDMLPEGARMGGAPLNVCYHLHRYGIQSQLVSQVGADVLGRAILTQLQDWQMDTTCCTTAEDYATSTVEVAIDANGQPAYTIVDKVAWDYIPYHATISEAVAEADAFVFGSLAVRHDETLDTLRKYLARSSNSVMDINLRRPHYQVDVLLELLKSTDMLKINEEEIVLLASWLDISQHNTDVDVTEIFQLYPRLKAIILTKGAHGATYYSRHTRHDVAAYAVSVVDTVGCGDAFLASFLASVLRQQSIPQALAAGALLSAFVATQSGACPSYTLSELEELKHAWLS